MRRKVSGVFLILMVLASSSLAQVRIREKISIDPKPPQIVQASAVGAATLVVTYTNTAPLRTVDVPRFFRVFYTGCGIDVAFDPASSAVASVPALGGTINALARFAVPAGGSGVAKITFAVNGEIIRIDSVIVNCFCTIQMNPTVFFYTGVNFAFDKGFGVHEITHGGSLGAAFANDHPFTPCSQTVWHPNLNTTFRITQGAELGAFYAANGDSIGTTVTGQQGYLAQITYKATGEQPEGFSGTVVIQATALGNIVGTTSLTVYRSAPLVDHFGIDFEPDTVDYGSSVTVYITAEDAENNEVSLDDNTVISLEMDQTQYGKFIDEEGNEVTEVPYADARDGLLQFIADGTNPELDTIKVVDITVSAIVEGEEVTGTGKAIIKAYLTKCVAIQFTPETIAPGDIAKLTFRPLDGEPFPEDQLFDVFLLSDEGILLSSNGALAKQFKGISDSLFYIAPDSLETDSIVVRMRAQTAPPKSGGPVIVASAAMASNGGEIVLAAPPSNLCALSGVVVKTKVVLKILEHAPWSIWPRLLAAGSQSRGADRPGYNPRRSFRIQVTDASNQPLPNKTIEIITTYKPTSGGHNHGFGSVELPAGEKQGTFSGQGNKGNPLFLLTDENGLATVESFEASQVSGEYLITASLMSDPRIKDTVNLEVRVPRLVNFRDLIIIGTRPFIFVQSDTGEANHPSNAWCTPEMGANLFLAILDFYQWTQSDDGGGTPVQISLNDMSLMLGGLFDIGADWKVDNPSHSFHRVGLSADINNTGLRVLVDNPDNPEKKISVLTSRGKKLVNLFQKRDATRYPEPQIHFEFDNAH